jgi:hypothetical protein
MKIFKTTKGDTTKQSKIWIKQLDSNTINVKIEYSVQSKLADYLNDRNVLASNPTIVLDENYTLNDIRTDNYDHAAYTLVSRQDVNFKFLNLFNFTQSAKLGKSSIAGGYGCNLDLIIYVPFNDSTFEDITIIGNTENLYFNNEEVIDQHNVDVYPVTFGTSCREFLPDILLSKDNNIIKAQLITSEGTPINKAGVDFIFETTTGYLTSTRATTDANGVAYTKVLGEELNGKVKVGFKHFTGKSEIKV